MELIHQHSFWVYDTGPDWLKHTFSENLEKSGFRIVGFVDHHFTPHGYSAVWLLAESHLAIHTFPELEKTHIEISSCSREKLDAFIDLSQKAITKGFLA